MKTRARKYIFAGSSLALAIGTLFTATFAWFNVANKAALNSGQGFTASSYFESGDGSATSPYVITKPIHLYNLAWLQYLGYFNKVENDAYQQVYFVLQDNIDMTSDESNNWTLPPIGTTDNPFIGSFDGNDYIISNLTVDNVLAEGHITRKPSTVTSLTGLDIVGTFGVVGDYNLNASYTYSSAINKVSNVYLDKVIVSSQSDSTLAGIVAGYVNGNISNVDVSDSGLSLKSGVTPLDSTNLTSNLSDYSTVGYATADYKSTHKITNTTISTPLTTNATYTYQGSGTSTGWGGSIDMYSLFSRLTYFFNNATESIDTSNYNVTEVYNDSTLYSSTSYAGTYDNYYDSSSPLKGSFSFHEDSGTYLYLTGRRDLSTEITNNYDATYTISSNGTYLSLNGKTLATTNQASSATAWYFSNFGDSGTVFTIINGTKYYLRATKTLSSSVTTSSTYWTSSATSLYETYRNKKYYLYLNNSSFAVSTSSSSGLSIEQVSPSSSETTTRDNGAAVLDSYFPLNVNSDYTANENNTGYIISGMSSSDKTYEDHGNIRVSSYSMDSIQYGLNGSSYYSEGDTHLEAVTKTATSNGSYVVISDDYNKDDTLNSTLKSKFSTKTSYEDLGLEKYKKSLDSLYSVFNDNSYNVYGLHFVGKSISMDETFLAPKALINKTEYSNYQLPRNAIDFNLKEKGKVNFFAGTYYTNNNSFFSLYEIDRNANQGISNIKKISKIYSSGNADDAYIYLYEDGTYSGSGTLPSGYTLAFDLSWIENPTVLQYALYYFEIPINEGEYSLSAVDQSGKKGAYLLYLDISANAQQVNRTTITELITSVTDTYEYPLGIGIVVSPTSLNKETTTALAGAAIALTNGFSGSFSLKKEDSTISIASDSVHYSSGFKGDDISLQKASDSSDLVVTPLSNNITTIKRLTTYDYNTTTKELTTTIVTEENGSKTFMDEDGNTVNEFTLDDGTVISNPTSDDVTIDTLTTGDLLTYRYTYEAESSTISLTFTLTHAQDASVSDSYVEKASGYSITLASTTDDLVIKVTLLSDSSYLISINGTTVTLGSEVDVTHSA
jgi:hypothetical protein